MARFQVVDTVVSATQIGPGYELLFEKVILHFGGGRPPEPGYRFVWRINGRRQTRGSARLPDLAEIDALTAAGWAKGWI